MVEDVFRRRKVNLLCARSKHHAYGFSYSFAKSCLVLVRELVTNVRLSRVIHVQSILRRDRVDEHDSETRQVMKIADHFKRVHPGAG